MSMWVARRSGPLATGLHNFDTLRNSCRKASSTAGQREEGWTLARATERHAGDVTSACRLGAFGHLLRPHMTQFWGGFDSPKHLREGVKKELVKFGKIS